MKRFLRLFITLIAVSSILMVAACQKEDKEGLSVVASTTMLGDLVAQIGGDHVEVTLLFGPGIDPHLAQPTGGDTKVIKEADLVVFNGLHLEAQFGQVLNAYRSKTIEVGELLDESDLLEADEEHDPHIWFSVPIWKKVTRFVGDNLKEIDPSHASYYETNIVSYLEQLDTLHAWILDEVSKLKENERILVTAHDAFNYFAHTYGFEVAAIEGVSTESEARPEDIKQVIDLIIEKNVKAVFIESTISPTTINAVISGAKDRGHIVIIGGELYSDALGVGDDSQYINAIKKNVTNIVSGLI